MSDVRVVIVDDSRTARLAVRAVLATEPGVQVVGEAADGDHALQVVQTLRPDLVLMDVYLPTGDGIEITGRVMAEVPTPVLVITSLDSRDPRLVYRAMEAGAVDVIGKPPPPGSPAYAGACRRINKLVRALARVPVVRRVARTRSESQRPPIQPTAPDAAQRRGAPSPAAPSSMPAATIRYLSEPKTSVRFALAVMGASTGGPMAVRDVLRGLPRPLPVPLGLVQHIMPGFGEGFANWLERETEHPVRIVTASVRMNAGTVYMAGDGAHLELTDPGTLDAVDGPPVESQRPSVDRLFQTAAQFLGKPVVAVLLTGMGRDGVNGMKRLYSAGAHTIAQDPDTCVVGAMPGGAIDAGAARVVASPEGIAAELRRVLGQPSAAADTNAGALSNRRAFNS